LSRLLINKGNKDDSEVKLANITWLEDRPQLYQNLLGSLRDLNLEITQYTNYIDAMLAIETISDSILIILDLIIDSGFTTKRTFLPSHNDFLGLEFMKHILSRYMHNSPPILILSIASDYPHVMKHNPELYQYIKEYKDKIYTLRKDSSPLDVKNKIKDILINSNKYAK